MEAELQIASLQSDLQTPARLEQKQNPPGLALVRSMGSRYHMCSASVFTSPHCCTVGDLEEGARLASGSSVTALTQWISGASSVRTFSKGQIPEPQLLFLFCCSCILRTPAALCRFSINPVLGLVVWSHCLWPQLGHTCSLLVFALFIMDLLYLCNYSFRMLELWSEEYVPV